MKYTMLLLGMLCGYVAGEVSGDYYFGNGCMWRVQHLITTQFEQQPPQNRTGAGLTATAGYAGGLSPPLPTCYHNTKNVSVYGNYGCAEAVRVRIESGDQLEAAARAYFGDFMSIGPLGPHGEDIWTRPDYGDVGAEYRALIGVPGGSGNAAALSILSKSNVHSLRLLPGKGSDADTLVNNTVWLYDAGTFPFRPAELCMQYHDDQSQAYPPEYHAVRDARVAVGTLNDTTCPTPVPCA
eukprot:Hpha_TRINITY_DN15888_c1_g6::TRINITY_DN15888_c1_g6_i1::g.188874::m.188874